MIVLIAVAVAVDDDNDDDDAVDDDEKKKNCSTSFVSHQTACRSWKMMMMKMNNFRA